VKQSVLLGILFVLVFLGFVVYTTLTTGRIRCEVCISYQGRRACRTAAGRTRDLALRTATDNTCAQIASGVTETNQCVNTTPDSVRWP